MPGRVRADTTTSAGAPRRVALQQAISHLATIERPSASDGERHAAEWIASRLRELGHAARVEEERAHGGYWWPLAVPNVVAAAAGIWLARRPRSPARRVAAVLTGAAAAAAVWDDVGGGRLWFRRAMLRRRSTWNVVAEAGDQGARRTVVLVAHHDAAHSGLIFHPALPRFAAERFPDLHARSSQSLPVMYGVWLGPALTAAAAVLGARRLAHLAVAFAGGATAVMIDIARSAVVPGANDNLSAVAVLLAVAESLGDRPLEGTRVLLVCTGAEESFMEGMQGFARRHFGGLDRGDVQMLCVECVGGPILTLLEGEGMLRMREYPTAAKEAVAAAARAAGVELRRGLRTVAATDALVALRRGYDVATLASVESTNFPSNYHWPSDTPENLNWETIESAIEVCEEFVRRG